MGGPLYSAEFFRDIYFRLSNVTETWSFHRISWTVSTMQQWAGAASKSVEGLAFNASAWAQNFAGDRGWLIVLAIYFVSVILLGICNKFTSHRRKVIIFLTKMIGKIEMLSNH